MSRYLTLWIAFLLLHETSCLPLLVENQTVSVAHLEKKGTIRIAGPWHSESALDRNIDPGEDTYVKKIISSNEGLNFNKDMAEAGEMFDVNGIEDFYDKNAMITYEVNGHEIPVHFKPKLTPQSKSMFPEYVKETPAAIGMTRQHKGAVNILSHLLSKPSNRLAAISGFTEKDLPEYAVQDTAAFHGLNNVDSLKNLRMQKFIKTEKVSPFGKIQNDVKLPWKSAESSAQIDELADHLHNKLIKSYDRSEFDKNQLNRYVSQQSGNSASQNGLDDQIHTNAIESFSKTNSDPLKLTSLTHSSKTIDQNHLLSENNVNNANSFHSKLDEDENSKAARKIHDPLEPVDRSVMLRFHKLHPVSKSENDQNQQFINTESTHDREILNHALEAQNYQEREVDNEKAEFHHSMPHHLEELKNEEKISSPGNSEGSNLLAKLADLHEKLESSNRESEVSNNEMPSLEPEKVKAKTRILSLLGELSNKLKGMEAVVTGKNNKKVEKYQSGEIENKQEPVLDQINNIDHESVAMFSKHQPPSGDDNLLATSSFQNYATQNSFPHDSFINEKEKENPSKEVSSFSSQDDKLDVNNQDSGTESHDTTSSRSEEAKFPVNTKPSNTEISYDQKQGENTNFGENDNMAEKYKNLLSKFQSLREEAERQHVDPEIIQKYHDENKPFVMDTNMIDYKPSKDDLISQTEHSNESEDEEDDPVLYPDVETHHQKVKGKYEKTKETYYEHDKQKSTHGKRRVSHHKKIFHEHSHKQKDDIDLIKKVSKSDDNDDDDDDDKDEKVNDEKIEKHVSNEDDHELAKSKNDETEDDQMNTHYQKVNKHSKDENDDDDEDEQKDKKVSEVAESLASADEEHDSGISRERTYRPKQKAAEDIEYPDYNDVKDAAIFETNLLRKNYHANKVSWSDRLSDRAQQAAEKLARKSNLEQSKLDLYKTPGENIALVKLASPNVGKEAIDKWSRESKYYDFKSPSVSHRNSDFVQLMWKADKEFGMGVAKSHNGDAWVVTSFYDNPSIDKYQDLKLNIESEVPTGDPYSDIVG